MAKNKKRKKKTVAKTAPFWGMEDDRELLEAVAEELALRKRLDPLMEHVMAIRETIENCKSIKVDLWSVDIVPEVKDRSDQKKVVDVFMEHWPEMHAELKGRFATRPTLVNLNERLRDYMLDVIEGDNSLTPEEVKSARIVSADYHLTEIFLQVHQYMLNLGCYREFADFGRGLLDFITFDDGKAGSDDVREAMQSLQLKKHGIAIKGDIGRCLDAVGEKEECDRWLKTMYEDEDADPWEAIEGVSVQLQVYLERAKAAPGDEDILLSARGLLEEWIDEDTEVDPDNLILYHRAEALYRALGDEDLAALYAKKAKDFIDECNREAREAAEEEAKWNRKIYPNDPCPCGSGKKFKKCHGRKKGM